MPFPALLAFFQTPLEAEAKSESRHLFVHTAVDAGPDSPAVKDRLDRLYAAAKASGWEVPEPREHGD